MAKLGHKTVLVAHPPAQPTTTKGRQAKLLAEAKKTNFLLSLSETHGAQREWRRAGLNLSDEPAEVEVPASTRRRQTRQTRLPTPPPKGRAQEAARTERREPPPVPVPRLRQRSCPGQRVDADEVADEDADAVALEDADAPV